MRQTENINKKSLSRRINKCRQRCHEKSAVQSVESFSKAGRKKQEASTSH